VKRFVSNKIFSGFLNSCLVKEVVVPAFFILKVFSSLLLHQFTPLLASRLHLRLTFKSGLNTGGWTNIRKTTLERMKKRLEQKNRERSQKYRDENKRMKKEIKSLTIKKTTTKSNLTDAEKIKKQKPF